MDSILGRLMPQQGVNCMIVHILRALCCALFLLTLTSTALAAPQTIEAEGVYTVGDNDSPKIARDAARQEAMRSALRAAGRTKGEVRA